MTLNAIAQKNDALGMQRDIQSPNNTEMEKKMLFMCPMCGSFEAPQLIRVFPPKTVKCVACGFEGEEHRFIHSSNGASCAEH